MKRIMFVLTLAIASVMNAFAQEEGKFPYAQMSEDETTITFYYGTGEESPAGYQMAIDFEGWRYREWDGYKEKITTVVFDASFADYTGLTTLAYWFYGFEKVTKFEGFENLHTENVKDLYRTFYGCKALTKLDLSTFNTANVEGTSQMFYNCQTLKTIYVSELWDMSNVTGSYQMFANCYELVGEKGTAYDRTETDVHRARIDGGEENPGYLTNIDGTDIKGLPANDASAPNAIFDLSGRRTQKPVKGIYIQGSKKVAIK